MWKKIGIWLFVNSVLPVMFIVAFIFSGLFFLHLLAEIFELVRTTEDGTYCWLIVPWFMVIMAIGRFLLSFGENS